MKTRFPSRQVLSDILKNDHLSSVSGIENTFAIKSQSAQTALLFSFILGIDQQPKEMDHLEIENLGDFFTQKILLKNKKPLTLLELLNDLNSLDTEDRLPLRKMFLIAEGGQHHLNNPTFETNARLVFTWQRSNSSPPDVLLSTVPVLNDQGSLLQLISWSNKNNTFNFFERKRGEWGWAGNSFHALNPLSRGKGPFDSHINGGLVMKELKFPWAHWHSQSSTISRANFGKDSEFNTQQVFSVLNGAEELESIVKTGIRRWTQSRIKSDIKDGQLKNFTNYFRQIIQPTSVNLTSSSVEFHQVQNVLLKLPTSFFFDIDGLEFAVNIIDPLTIAIPEGKLELKGSLYKHHITALNMHITSGEGIKLKGDTHFCFLVPERAFEDFEVIRQLVENGILNARLLLALLLVDFSNPVESEHRAALFLYCPSSVTIIDGQSNFGDLWIAAIKAGNFSKDSPEAEFLEYWEEEDLLQRVSAELHLFFENIQRNLNDSDYVVKLLHLAEYRKDFYRVRKFDLLDEFPATTSRIDVNLPKWTMDKIGNITNI